jgi:DNA mismatch repair protein MutS
MAGKSTYIRQVGVIVLLAHLGMYVPAEKAKIGVIDKLYARSGLVDEIAKGKSTFLVEMSQTANIINNASGKSLVILDEVGRGTSTYDGLSLSWAIVEYVHDGIGCKTLFATHYHELVNLSLFLPFVRNYHVAVKEWQEKVVFLYKILPGGTDRSYGIHVAKLAAIPNEITQRATSILHELETRNDAVGQNISKYITPQLPLFSGDSGSKTEDLEKELRKVEIEKMTPIEALIKLKELRGKIE